MVTCRSLDERSGLFEGAVAEPLVMLTFGPPLGLGPLALCGGGLGARGLLFAIGAGVSRCVIVRFAVRITPGPWFRLTRESPLNGQASKPCGF